MTRPPAPALSDAEAATVARFDAAPVPPEVVVENVARAMAEAQGCGRTATPLTRRLAAAAIAAMPASPAEERLQLDSPGELLRGDVVVQVEWDDAVEYMITVDRRAALASPAPAPHAEEGR